MTRKIDLKEIFKKLAFSIYLSIKSIQYYIGLSLFNTEAKILKSTNDDLLKSRNDKTQRQRHKNQTLEKFYAGQRDEKYIQDFYEITKKADNFMKNATNREMEIAAYKYGTSYGMTDKYGRKHEHYGFFDTKHKNYGKTLAEVLKDEESTRRTNDDDYPIKYMFNNTPTEVGLTKLDNIVVKIDEDSYRAADVTEKSKMYEYPIKVIRDEGFVCINKIEELTEYLHVKDLSFNRVQLEFFIPLRYKINEIEENSEIFLQITKFNYIFVKNKYGEPIYFNITNFKKRIIINDTHEVWKFYGNEMEKSGFEKNSETCQIF